MSTFAELAPIMVERAEGPYLIDVNGKRYLDAISSLWVTTIGHNNGEINDAIATQLSKVAHSTLLGNSNTAIVELSEALAEIVPVNDPHFLYASDGAAAVEQALKIAFQYWTNLGNFQKTKFLTLSHAYHGDTVGSLSLGDGGFGTDIFNPLRFNSIKTPGYNVDNWLYRAILELEANYNVLAALVIEPLVQGASGMYIAMPEQVKELVKVAQSLGVTVIADEVATGFGRTGKMFASDLCGINPDIMCLGKGLTGGYLPMSVTVVSNRIYDAFLGPDRSEKTFYHGHSFSGNPLCAAAAKKHLEILQRDSIIEKVKERQHHLSVELDKKIKCLPLVKDIRQAGLMVGIEIKSSDDPGHRGRVVCMNAVQNGVLLRPLGDVIVLMPHLNFSKANLTKTVDVLERSINQLL
jgi:adenosylmethionine-8-amino-7-oxononanoate aminotransferase